MDDTDIDENEVVTILQVSKQVRSSMKKWITKQNDVFLAQLREDEHYSLRVTPNEKRLGPFLVSIRCAACGKSIMLSQKNMSTYVVSNWYRHAKLCITKAKSATRLTQLPLQKCLPKSLHSGAKISTHDTASKSAIDITDFS